MSNRAKNVMTENEKMQQILSAELERYYYQLGVSVFEWVGMPEQKLRIPIRQIEKLLYYNGTATMFYDELSGQYMVLPVAEMSIVKNVYGEPSQWRAMALGEAAGRINEKVLTWDNAVLFRNNDSYSASAPYIRELVRNMVNVEFTKRLNINAQKVSVQFKSSDRNVLSDKQQFMMLMECEPVIYTDKMMMESMEPISFDIKPIMAELDDAYNVYDQRACEYLGIDCVARDKAERLTVEEATGNNQKIAVIRQNKLRQRKFAVEKVRELFPDLGEFDCVLSDEVMTKETDMKEDEEVEADDD